MRAETPATLEDIRARSRMVTCGLPALCVLFAAVSIMLGSAGASSGSGPQTDHHGRRLTTSSACRADLDSMLRDANWLFVNDTWTKWCRIKLESTMAICCKLEDFNRGYAEMCSGCMADCTHTQMTTLCNKWFGQAGTLVRHPFLNTGAPDVAVTETFCVPSSCTNAADLTAIMPWYSAIYRSRRAGWFLSYDDASITIPSNAGTIVVIVIAVVVAIALMIPLGIILFQAPKERGRTLISQAEMQAAEDEGEGNAQ